MTDVQEKYSQVENVTKQALTQGYVPHARHWAKKLPEELAASVDVWYQNIENNLAIDIESVKREFNDDSLIKIETYSSNSPKWDMFLSRDKKQHVKVYSKRCWTGLPARSHMEPFYDKYFFPWLSKNTNTILPAVLYNTENFIGVEWCSPDDGWRFATTQDFVYTGSNNIKVNQPVITSLFKDVLRDFQSLYETAGKHFNRMRLPEIREWGKNTEYVNDLYVRLEHYLARATGARRLKRDKSNWRKRDHKITVQPTSVWIRDFVVSKDKKQCKYVDVENLHIWDVTRFNLWNHKYRLQTDLGDETNERQWVGHEYSDPGVEHDDMIRDPNKIAYSLYIDQWFHQSIIK